MNLLILALMISVALFNIYHFLGLIVGLAICYLFFDDKGEKSTIVYHLTHWSWIDWRV